MVLSLSSQIILQVLCKVIFFISTVKILCSDIQPVNFFDISERITRFMVIDWVATIVKI